MINVCTLSICLALILLGGSVATLTVPKSQHDEIKQVFSAELADTYTKIVAERRNHYLQGLSLGMILALVMTYFIWPVRQIYHVSSFVAITLFTAMIYYRLVPKSDYMLNHLKTQEQNKAWLNMYKAYQTRYLYGMILGGLSSLFVARAICKST